MRPKNRRKNVPLSTTGNLSEQSLFCNWRWENSKKANKPEVRQSEDSTIMTKDSISKLALLDVFSVSATIWLYTNLYRRLSYFRIVPETIL